MKSYFANIKFYYVHVQEKTERNIATTVYVLTTKTIQKITNDEKNMIV